MSIEVTNLDQLEVGTVVEQKSSENGTTTHWIVTSIKAPPMSSGNIAVYGERVRKSDHQVIKRASNGLPTYSGILVWFIAGELKNAWYSLAVIDSKRKEQMVHRGESPSFQQARCNKKFVWDGMTVSSNWEEVTCGRCLKQYIRHDGKKNSPLTLLEYEHEYVTKVGELEEQERLSICCGAEEDENIENMCSSCHESTTFFKVFGPEKKEEKTPSPVKFETVVHSNMVQLIGELSSAVAYLEDMNISNEDTGLIDQSEGLSKAIRNAKNIAFCLRQDAIDRKEINVA